MVNRAVQLAILGGCIVLLWILSKRQKSAEKEKKRRELLKKDYPELISKLLLLLQAGLVSRSAFKRIAEDYRKDLAAGKAERPAFEEVRLLCAEMEKGIGEEEAYVRFGRRCVLPSYRTLSVLLVQNMKKGGDALPETLETEIVQAQEEKKRSARVEGEKASIRLLLPMGMMLVVVLAVMIIPAFLSI